MIEAILSHPVLAGLAAVILLAVIVGAGFYCYMLWSTRRDDLPEARAHPGESGPH